MGVFISFDLSTWTTIPGLSGKVRLCCKTINCLSEGFWHLVFPPVNGDNFVVLPSPSIQCSWHLDFILIGVQ